MQRPALAAAKGPVTLLRPAPVSAAPGPGPGPAAGPGAGPAPSGLVLVVEDNPITCKLLCVAVELGGFAVLDAGDGRTALEIVARQPPDLLVLDYLLPDMDGLEVLAEARHTLGAEVPAVLVTGMISHLDALRARAGPSTHFLSKPVEPSVLLQVVRADAGQVEQVLLNLAINARDAMDGGGRLVIETANVDLDDADVRSNPDARAGRFVALMVSDSGHGMTADTMAHIFEPFFTTKENGKGTGLGLATAYGIVRQSGGTVSVSSEPGRGTIFKVYLPRVDEQVEKRPPAAPAAAQGGTETVLLVGDAGALRNAVREILEDVGYTVRDADSPDAALAFVQSTRDPIDLVLTDMVMPRMSGQELARRIAAIKPETRVVFMSGYADQVVGEEGTLSPDTPFLQKPFTTDALLKVLRQALDAERNV